jgi:hypothetical protein
MINFHQINDRILGNKLASFYLPLFISAIAIGNYYWIVLKYNVNIPVSDDYGVALQLLNNFLSTDSIGEKVGLLFRQHVDHRVMFPKLVVLLDYFFEGHVNFYSLVVIGNLGLIFLVVILYRSFPERVGKFLLYCPVVLLLFQLQHWENAGFPTASIQSFFVVVFSFACLYYLSQPSKPSICFALLFFFLAVFTSGNGIFCVVPGVLILLIQKRYKLLGLWLLTFSTFALGYFYDFSKPNVHIFQLFVERPIDVLTAFFVAIGGFINFSKAWEPIGIGYPLSIMFGLIVTLFFLYLTFSKYYLRAPVLYGFLFFLLITCAAMAVSRISHYSANELSTVSRYKIVSLCCISVSYLIFIDLWKSLGLFKAFLFIPLGLYYNDTGNERNLPIFKSHTDRLLESSWAVYSSNDYSKLMDWNPALSAETLRQSQVKDAYVLPDLRDDFLKRVPDAYQLPPISAEQIIPADSTVKYQIIIHTTKDGLRCGTRKGWALAKGKVTKRNLFVLKDSVKSYFFSTAIEYRGDLSEMMMALDPLDKTNYSDSGFNVSVSISGLTKGEYEVGVLLETWDQFLYYIPTPEKIVVK